MKTLLILIFSLVLFCSILLWIVGATIGWIVTILAVIAFIFIDWDNMPWLKLKWKY
jgi:hypothetical protein